MHTQVKKESYLKGQASSRLLHTERSCGIAVPHALQQLVGGAKHPGPRVLLTGQLVAVPGLDALLVDINDDHLDVGALQGDHGHCREGRSSGSWSAGAMVHESVAGASKPNDEALPHRRAQLHSSFPTAT